MLEQGNKIILLPFQALEAHSCTFDFLSKVINTTDCWGLFFAVFSK